MKETWKESISSFRLGKKTMHRVGQEFCVCFDYRQLLLPDVVQEFGTVLPGERERERGNRETGAGGPVSNVPMQRK